MIKGIVFDLDGVLVDAVEWHYKSLNQALCLFGYRISEEEHQTFFNGLSTALKLEVLSSREFLPRGLHGIINELKQKFFAEQLAAHCRPNPQLIALLTHLKQSGYRLAVASNSIRTTVDEVLARLKITDFFDFSLSNNDVSNPKPHAEIYNLALTKLQCMPEECLVIEDNVYGFQAAKQVTPKVGMVTSPDDLTLDFMQRTLARFSDEKPSRVGNKIRIVVPMAGAGRRFQEAGYHAPKPFIEVNGKPMIEWVIENVAPLYYPSQFIFLCNQEHLKTNGASDILRKSSPECGILSVKGLTGGAACTALLAHEALQNENPLIIANSDQWVESEIDDFICKAILTDADGLIMTFPATHPKWSFVKTNPRGWVTEVAEKQPISNRATVGIYYFKRSSDFISAAESMIRKNITTNGEFYVCPIYNEMIQAGKKILTYEIESHQMHGLGTPDDLILFLDHLKKQDSVNLQTLQVPKSLAIPQ